MREPEKKKNETLLEMYLGMTAYGILCQIIGIFLVKNRFSYTISLWSGVLLSMASALHMAKTLEKGMDRGEDGARKAVFGGYLTRYALFALFLLIMSRIECMNLLVIFLGYMGMKASALIWPVTHKIYDRLLKRKSQEGGEE